jgi:copper chaperone CopZ
MAQTNVTIDGMSCGHCVSRVKQAIDDLDGVSQSAVETGSASVTYDEGKLSSADIEAAVEKAGYKIHRD